MISNKAQKELLKAIKIMGSQQALSTKIGCSQSLLSHMLNQDNYKFIHPKWAKKIVAECKDKDKKAIVSFEVLIS